MAEAPVTGSSPLIVLARSGWLHLLRHSAPLVVVPGAVAAEVQWRGPADHTVGALEQNSWLEVIEIPAVPDQIAPLRLGEDESAALAWAMSYPGSTLILDDMAARRAAERLGLPLLGTLGVVLTAKAAGAIAFARPVLEDLRRAGMYLSEHAMNEALALVDE